ncbi:hypothetical protein H0H92_015073, partial [Tricholoma furcatifolium]
MEKVFLGVVANVTDNRVLRAVRGVLDFIYYAGFEVHTDESLAQLEDAWRLFHDNKQVFMDLEIRKHFNISKLHNIKHYLNSIRALGSACGYNTEATERLHIDLAKLGYRASNKKDYVKQMVTWLQRQEIVERFDRYLKWNDELVGKAVEQEGDDMVDDDEANSDTQESTTIHVPRVSKKPAFPRANVISIIQDY